MKKQKAIVYNTATDGQRWVENVGEGLRLAGFADELARIDHKGWFIDEHCNEVYRGVVYQIPGRNGFPLFIPGYADPFNDDRALMDFPSAKNCQIDAAHCADEIADTAAESERDYRKGSAAGARFIDLGEQLTATREKLKAGLSGVRELSQLAGIPTATCALIRERLAELWQQSREIISERHSIKTECRYDEEKTGFEHAIT